MDSSKQHYFAAVEGLPLNNICIKIDSVLITGLVSLDMQLVWKCAFIKDMYDKICT